jgi:hypothetical protein
MAYTGPEPVEGWKAYFIAKKYLPLYSREETTKHKTGESAWIIMRNKVYDITKWLNEHPGIPHHF